MNHELILQFIIPFSSFLQRTVKTKVYLRIRQKLIPSSSLFPLFNISTSSEGIFENNKDVLLTNFHILDFLRNFLKWEPSDSFSLRVVVIQRVWKNFSQYLVPSSSFPQFCTLQTRLLWTSRAYFWEGVLNVAE